MPGAAGTWKDLTANVNLLAANLTTQVRAIAEVATAVTKGDLTRAIQVDARGEVAEFKDNINTMITNLRLTTERNTEQDWLKTNLARFTDMLQGQRDLGTVGRLLLTELSPLVNAQKGVIYQVESEDSPRLHLLAAYASDGNFPHKQTLQLGEGLVGQCAMDKRQRLVSDIPADAVPVSSALMRVVPRNLVVLPVLFENQVKAVIELASLSSFTTSQMGFLEQLTNSIGIVLNSIEATMQTEGLLKQSQQLAGELQTQQRELQQTNDQLEQKAQQLAERNVEVEAKNQEIEQARRALEEMLGQDDRVVLGGQEDAGPEADAGRDRGGGRQRHQRVETALVVVEAYPLDERRRDVLAHRQVGVLGQPERVEPELLHRQSQCGWREVEVGEGGGDAQAHGQVPGGTLAADSARVPPPTAAPSNAA